MPDPKKKMDSDSVIRRILRGLTTIASWQFAAFTVLLLLIWVNEMFDLPAWVYGQEPRSPNYFAAALLSAFVLIIAITTVGHTYTKQRELLAGMITVCMHCHKVRIDNEVWQAIESYIARRAPVEFSHGLCPECFEVEMADLVEHKEQPPQSHAPALKAT